MAIQTETQNTVMTAEVFGKTHMPKRQTEERGRLAQALGWFSIGLGLAEVIAPSVIARVAGTRKHHWLIRGFGMREMAAGIGILSMSRRAPWMWSRVAGDILDLGALGGVLGNRRNDRGKAVFTIASVAGVTALDIYCAQRLTGASRNWPAAETSMIVDRSPEECYRFWRQLDNLPRFMSYLEAVQPTADGRSHWIVRGPGGARIEWDAEITEDIPNQRIAWRTIIGSEPCHSGAVDFESAPGNRGTIVRVQMTYGPQFRALHPLATLAGRNPESMIRKELRRFKQVLETGEVITTAGQSAGRDESVTWLDRVAR